jgi:hypothetical protein
MRPARPAGPALLRPPQHTLVENRTVYTLDAFELNVFEMHQVAQRVPLNLAAASSWWTCVSGWVLTVPGISGAV